MTVHPIPPVFDKESRVLILGSFPSVKSREVMFYYGHPQNRFWRVLGTVLGCDFPDGAEERRELLLKNKVALWDVIASCEITGSSDSSVRNVVPNDISEILGNGNIRAIFVNGKCAEKYYRKYIKPTTEIECITLPSTSPATAAFSYEKLCEHWSEISEKLK